MMEMLARFGRLLELFDDINPASGPNLTQPLLAAVCLTVAEAATYVNHEAGVADGTRPSFLALDQSPLVVTCHHAASSQPGALAA
jgi:hypothetical protein